MAPEEHILVPRNANTESDDWPEFELLKVRVYDPDQPDVLVSLLEASDHHPLMLTGALQPRYDKASARLYVGRARSAQISVQPIKLYAYGELEEGGIAIWAAGGAGWFGITPAPEYQPIYETMVKAVKILYFVADAHNSGEKSAKGKKANVSVDIRVSELFKRYAKAHSLMKVEEAEAEIYEHRGFLLASMIAGKEGIVWSRNPLYIHLSRKFPQDLTLAKERVNGPSIGAPTQVLPTPADSAATQTTNKRKRKPDGVRPSAEPIALRKHGSTRSTPVSIDVNGRAAAEMETDSSTPTVREIDTDEDKAPRKGRKRKSALRLKPVTGQKGLPYTNRPSEKIADEEELEIDANRRDVAVDATRQSQQPKQKHSRRGADDNINVTVASPVDPPPPLPDPPDTFDQVQEDTWVCALDGCTHKIYDAADADSQRLIRAHYELHAFDNDARVKLVQRLQAPSLPVKHLMERVKLQAKADGSAMDADASRSRAPLHVVQRY